MSHKMKGAEAWSIITPIKVDAAGVPTIEVFEMDKTIGADGLTYTPRLRKFIIVQLSIIKALPEMKLIPIRPDPIPWIRRLRKMTTSLGPALMLIPFVPATSTEATWPLPPSIVIAFVIVTAPNPPGSKASISPPAAVLEIAPAMVLHGAVRLPGFASSPTPEIQVRDA